MPRKEKRPDSVPAKRQFKGTSVPKTFYDRRVRLVGYTRVVSLGKIIPEDWAYVRMRVLNKTPDTIEVLFTKLLGRDKDAPAEEPSEEGE